MRQAQAYRLTHTITALYSSPDHQSGPSVTAFRREAEREREREREKRKESGQKKDLGNRGKVEDPWTPIVCYVGSRTRTTRPLTSFRNRGVRAVAGNTAGRYLGVGDRHESQGVVWAAFSPRACVGPMVSRPKRHHQTQPASAKEVDCLQHGRTAELMMLTARTKPLNRIAPEQVERDTLVAHRT
jgi:hypothetical protein